MDWVGDLVGRVRGVIGMVHTVSVQGVKWAWEEEREERFEEIKDEKEDTEKVEEPCVKRLGDVVEDFGLKIPYKQPSQDSQV